MIYYYIKQKDNNIGIGCTDNLDHMINHITAEITKEKYDSLVTRDKIIYLDSNNELQLRDRFTKLDESSKTWIPDNDAIAENKRNELKSKAQQALNETNYYEMESYKITCDNEENKANLEYRIQLHLILKDKYDSIKLPINPNKKE